MSTDYNKSVIDRKFEKVFLLHNIYTYSKQVDIRKLKFYKNGLIDCYSLIRFESK